MALQTQSAQIGPADAYQLIRATAAGMKQQATVALATLAADNVTPPWVFSLTDQFIHFISELATWGAVPNLDAYATAQGYPESLIADGTATYNAAIAVVNWIVTNYPSSGGYLQSEVMNSDGTRTLRQFAPTDTAGWRTVITAFIATIN